MAAHDHPDFYEHLDRERALSRISAKYDAMSPVERVIDRCEKTISRIEGRGLRNYQLANLANNCRHHGFDLFADWRDWRNAAAWIERHGVSAAVDRIRSVTAQLKQGQAA
ncbi:hypothetical protein [Ponticaulis profundi]|uniref:Uncharacterized protein n=1 Tax=Ponticaulis profundi TaxID=2665222 RepID=A0ABW1S9G8_9PROT